MENSKLVRLLQKFNEAEIELLKCFMSSPYFVKRGTLIEFAKLVLNAYPAFKGSKVNEKAIYNKLYPGEIFQHKTVYKLMNLMIANIHRFLAIENFLRDKEENSLRLMESLRAKGLGNEFLRVSAIYSNDLEGGYKDQQYFYHIMRRENELDSYYNLSKEHFGFATYLQKKSDALDSYFISAKLKLACDMINRQNIFSSETKFNLLNEIVEYVAHNVEEYEKMPAVIVYYRVILTLLQPDEEKHFQDLQATLARATEYFSSNELREVFGFAQNYCIKKINSGKVQYVRELFKIYLKLLETGVIYENNFLTQWDYKNIATIGLRLKEYEWTENFIQSNKSKIQPNYREMAYCYNLANLHYERKKFKEALKTLLQFNDALKQITDPGFEDTFYNIDSRSMFLKIYYDLEEEESFVATIETFKSYLNRNKKISDGMKVTCLNLLKYTKKLNDQRWKLSYKTRKPDGKGILNLKKEINAEKQVANLAWLQSRVDDLEKRVLKA